MLGLKIVVCFIFYNVKGLFKVVIWDNNLVLFFEYVFLYNLKENLFDYEYIVFLDKVEVVCFGKDVIILIYFCMCYYCL